MGSFKPVDPERHARFERFKEALLRLHGIDIDEWGQGIKACGLLGIESNVLTNWRRRGLPPEALPVAAERGGINPGFILGIDKAMAVPPKQIKNDPTTVPARGLKEH
jgi:hypothetical protein